MDQRALRLRVTCPCGATTSVPAGTPAVCSCGRTWYTTSLPTEDVAGVRSSVRRLRRRQGRFVLNLLLAVGVLLLLRTSMPVLVIVPVFALLWLRLCLPWWRSRHESLVTGAPTWTLTPAVAAPAAIPTTERQAR